MTASTIHFTVTISGIGGIFFTVLGCGYRLGRILQRLESHIDESNEIHKVIGDRVTWLERRRRP